MNKRLRLSGLIVGCVPEYSLDLSSFGDSYQGFVNESLHRVCIVKRDAILVLEKTTMRLMGMNGLELSVDDQNLAPNDRAEHRKLLGLASSEVSENCLEIWTYDDLDLRIYFTHGEGGILRTIYSIGEDYDVFGPGWIEKTKGQYQIGTVTETITITEVVKSDPSDQLITGPAKTTTTVRTGSRYDFGM